MKKRVTVLVIGPTRTATTALWQGLKGVETVSVASTKENYFFGRRIAGKSDQPYGDYLSKHFARNIRVDFEPSIFHSDDQLREALPRPVSTALSGFSGHRSTCIKVPTAITLVTA